MYSIIQPVTLHVSITWLENLMNKGQLSIGSVIAIKRRGRTIRNSTIHSSNKPEDRSMPKVYVAAPAKGRGYAGNLPWCNRCKAHHQPGPCPPRCGVIAVVKEPESKETKLMVLKLVEWCHALGENKGQISEILLRMEVGKINASADRSVDIAKIVDDVLHFEDWIEK
ncbi:hypothetical protein Tco_1304852 [Tanacetum coccineum]